ncbi:SDR family oxidoreductase [Ferrovum sp. PN-J185]|uniref:SDR family oxidoreductase n=1 Tax=Ferrovum sp. PN-J185 TaxID=1356306 RepID=UPI001E390B57|nr:SDR family oxidoreductase [Ferrovum sp. PN-J185]MCC6068773.1 SDR family oxidoreductase [Ferrovum sp. PN-J185]
MKVSITGSNGILGSELCKLNEKMGHYVQKIPREFLYFENKSKLVNLIKDSDCIIHCAANTNVEQCETNWKECYRDNSLLTEHLSHVVSRENIKIVFISSTGVYGKQSSEPYTEYDFPNPTTHHHRSKLLGENAVLKLSGSLVIRTGWLFGGDKFNHKNFVQKRIDEAMSDVKYISANYTQKGSPSYVVDIAIRIMDLVSSKCEGIFNCVNTDFASRYEYVFHIFKNLGLEHKLVPQPSEYFSRKADVSHNEMALNLKMEQYGFPQMRSWKEAIDDYMNSLKLNF